MTLLELLYSSLRVIGAKNPGVTPTAAEVADAKEILNLMLDEWSVDGLMVYAHTFDDLTLTIADYDYTIGTGGTFSTVRPTQILNAYVRDSGNLDHPVDIIGAAQYQAILDKATSGRPDRLFYNPGTTLGTIYLYPAPDAAETLHLDSLKALSELTDLTATITFPPGYRSAIQSNLAVKLCPEYQREPSTVLVRDAQVSLKAIKRLNAANRCEPVSVGYLGRGEGYAETIFDG